MGLAILYGGFRFAPGEEILTTSHDHYVTDKSLDFAAARTGAVIRRIDMYEDPASATAAHMVDQVKDNLTHNTRLVAITYVHSGTGVKTPIRQIASMIRDMNQTRDTVDRIYLSVDGVHGFGVENITMQDLDCDFFSAGTHKWMFGPRGTGILFARKDAWHMITSVIPSFEDAPYLQWMGLVPPGDPTFADLCTPGGFHSFEHRWALNEAFDFMLTIGKERVEKRTHALSALLKDGLSQISHVRLVTPRNAEVSAGINCFEVEGMSPESVVKKLRSKKIISSQAPYKTSFVRLTPCITNTEGEVLACLKALETIRE
jgi:selenocysteine lyase/cysteine desulfurase